jgi:hypothetical protein
MSQHDKHSRHERGKHDHTASHSSSRKPIHRDWRLWVAVALMLGAMGIYVATMDEALVPGGQIGAEVPADAE